MRNKKYEQLLRRVTLAPIEGIRREIQFRDGMALKAEGQAAATDAALSWHQQGLKWISEQKPFAVFTADDLVEAIGLPRSTVHSNWNNAVGSLFTAAHKLGLIQTTGEYVRSSRTSNHARVLAEWWRTSTEEN